MVSSARWNIAVSAETDKDVRAFLANIENGPKRDLSQFVEEAVQAKIFELSVREAKANNMKVDENFLTSAIEDAVLLARYQK